MPPRFVEALPSTVRSIAVLDRTKEPGAGGEPLYLDCVNALYEQRRRDVQVVGGRYGLSSKEFTPAMIKAVFDNLAQPSPKNHFTVGIDDDVSHTSLDVRSGLFRSNRTTSFARSSSGSGPTARSAPTRNRSKSSAKTPTTSRRDISFTIRRKSGAMTISHLRFGPQPIRSTYLITKANFVACHQPFLLETLRRFAGSRRAGRSC